LNYDLVFSSLGKAGPPMGLGWSGLRSLVWQLAALTCFVVGFNAVFLAGALRHSLWRDDDLQIIATVLFGLYSANCACIVLAKTSKRLESEGPWLTRLFSIGIGASVILVGFSWIFHESDVLNPLKTAPNTVGNYSGADDFEAFVDLTLVPAIAVSLSWVTLETIRLALVPALTADRQDQTTPESAYTAANR
jgi:hypothetical protein